MLTAWRLTALVPVIVVVFSAPAAAQSFYGSLISVSPVCAPESFSETGVLPDESNSRLPRPNCCLRRL